MEVLHLIMEPAPYSSAQSRHRASFKAHLLMVIVGVLLLLTVEGGGGSSSSESAGSSTSAPDVPHIIFFLIDDQGYDDMGYQSTSNGYMAEFTPSLDAAAESGVKLTWYYSDHLCSPSRASIMTGKNLLHHGVSHNVLSEKSANALSLNHKILPQFLNDAGYISHAIGKWHLGFFNHKFLPTSRGFESYMGYYSGNFDYYGHYVLWGTTKMYDLHLDQGIFGDTSTYSLELFDQRAEEVIKSHDSDQPLFLYYATHGIHGTYSDPPPKMLTETQNELAVNTVANETGSTQREYLVKTAAAVDDTFYNLIEYLTEKGMYENSIIIVASDNGGCSNTMGSNYPLRGQKNTMFEAAFRVSAFVHSPLLGDAQGTELDCMVHNVDWLPTILHGIVGWEGDLGPLDGVNHWDDIVKADKSQATCARQEMIHQLEVGDKWGGTYFEDTLRAGLRLGDFKLVYGQDELGWWDDRSYSATDCDSVPTYWPNFGYVFNLADDYTEQHNLMDIVDDAVLSSLWRRLDYYFQKMANPAWRGPDNNARDEWIRNDYWMRPWVEDADVHSPEDPWQAEMAEKNSIRIEDGHDHAERTSRSRTDDGSGQR